MMNMSLEVGWLVYIKKLTEFFKISGMYSN